MPKLAALKRDTGTVEIPTEGDESLIVTYRKSFVSPHLAEQLARLSAMPPVEQFGVVAAMVAAAVSEWNLTDDGGQVLPLTLDSINRIDASALQTIMAAIQEDTRPDPLNESSSSPSSSQAEGSDAARTGTAS